MHSTHDRVLVKNNHLVSRFERNFRWFPSSWLQTPTHEMFDRRFSEKHGFMCNDVLGFGNRMGLFAMMYLEWFHLFRDVEFLIYEIFIFVYSRICLEKGFLFGIRNVDKFTITLNIIRINLIQYLVLCAFHFSVSFLKFDRPYM